MIKILVTGKFSQHRRVAEQIDNDKSTVFFENIKPLIAQMNLSETYFETTVTDSTGSPLINMGQICNAAERA